MALEVLSIVITPVTEVGKYLVGKLKTEFDYVTKYNSYLSKFHEELDQLQKKKEDVDERVKKAERELKAPTKEVLGWVEMVENLEKECMPLTLNGSSGKKCLQVLDCSRRRTSKQLLKLTKDICSLQEKGRFTHIADLPPSLAVVPMGQRGTVENIPSRELIKNEVMEALKDDNIRSIGVHGMGGIGKTTLVNSINDELCVNRSFKKVIVVTVSKDPDMKIIQNIIAERLDLKLEKEDMPTRANELFERLRSEESVLIILDDVWKPVELGKIGLGNSSKHMPCNIIVTTRNANVCSGMEVEKVFKMDILPEGEDWTLFKAKAGNVVVEMPSLEPIARAIVSRCKGSPLAIAALGSTLRAVKEEPIWAHALQVLKEPNAMGLEDIMPEVVTSLKWSYDHLKKKPNVQRCFLYCCLFPEDYDIRLTDLRNYGIGEGFLNMASTLEGALNELHFYVKILKDCCLLLDGADKSSVKMHDVVRDVAICIASNDEYGFLVNVGGGSKYLPESDQDMLLPNGLECPPLRSLLVRHSDSDETFSFEGVKSLLVLNMSYELGTKARLSVSESISQLRNLRTLYLYNCVLLDKTYLLGGLTKLEVLSMRWSNIGELPVEFGNLINLKFLDLTNARINFVAPNVFSRFLKMEELLIAGSIEGWGTTGELKDDDDNGRWRIGEDGSRRQAELKEVLSLPRLSVLDIEIDRPLSDGEVFNYHNLQHFCINVDYDAEMDEAFTYDMNTLYIGRTDLGKHWIRNLIAVSNKSMDLQLRECGGFKSVTDLNPAGSFNHLQYLYLAECNDVESVIVADRSAITAQDSFERLEILQLHNMDKMERILHGATSSPKFFGKLKQLTVRKCSKIGTIFPCNLLFTHKRLENLSTLDVRNCDEVQYIFNTEDNEFGATPTITALLSGVTDIALFSLPKLKSIWKGIMPEGSFHGLTKLSVKECHSLKHFLPSNVAGLLQNLERIEIERCDAMETIIFPTREEAEETSLLPRYIFNTEENEFGATPAITALLSGVTDIALFSLPKLKSIWKGIMPEGSFQGLTRLSVVECDSLQYLLPSNVAGLLQNLEEIEIVHCAAMETVIYPIGEEVDETSLFPRCRFLTIKFCPKLKNIFPFGVASHLHLEEIKIEDCDAMETLIYPIGEEAEETSLFPKCRILTIKSCPKLKNIFPFGVARHLHQLNSLSISHCHGLRFIFGNGEDPRITEHNCLLPGLKYLKLCDLKRLTRFNQDNLPISGPLEKIKVLLCPHLVTLPLQTVSALKLFHAEDIWFRRLESKDGSLASMLQPFIPPFSQVSKDVPAPVVRLIDGEMQDVPTPVVRLIDGELETLCWKVARIWLDDYDSQLECTTHLRTILSEMRWYATIEHVVRLDVVPCLVEILNREDHTQLQSEATWVLAYIASGSSDHSKVVIDHGVVPIFVKLIDSPNKDIREHAIWALGNVAADSPEYRDIVLGHKALVPLLAQLSDCSEVSITRNALWTISNFFAVKPQPPFEQVKTALLSLQCLLHSKNEILCIDACCALSCLLDGTSDKAQAVTEIGILPQLVELLIHPSPSVLISSLRAIGNIVCGDNGQTLCTCIIDNQALPYIFNLLTHHDVRIKKDACRIISEITAGNKECIQSVIVANIIAPLVHLLETAKSDIKKEAARAISNATCHGTQKQINHLVKQGCIKPFCDLLRCSDSSIIVVCLQGLSNILKVGKTDDMGIMNRYVQIIDDYGFQNIVYLQSHDISEIQQKAVAILKSLQLEKYTHFAGDATVASSQSGESESNCVEEETICSTEIENPASKCKQIDLNYPPSSLIELAKECQVDQMPDEEPYVRDITSNASVKNADNSLRSSSTEQAKQSCVTQTPELELHPIETWRNFFMKLDLNSLPTSAMELEKESHVSQMPKQDNHESDSTVWDNSENVVMGGSTSIATTSAHDEVWNDQRNIQVHCFFKPYEGIVKIPKTDLNCTPSSPIEIAKECQVDQMPDKEPYVRDIMSHASVKIDDNNSQSSSTEQAKQSHVTQTPKDELHLIETSMIFL